MNPVAFSLFGLEIRWYGIFISLGIILGLLVAMYVSKIRNVNYDHILDTLIVALPCGIIGARLYYVLFNFSQYSDNPIDILNIRQGGLAIHGGIIFGLIGAYLFTKYKGYDFLALLDTVAPSIILAQALGRWGNFFNMEAHGDVVTKEYISNFPEFIQRGMYIDGAYRHPTFLYESIWNLIVFIVLLYIIYRFSTLKGIVFFSYIGLYSIGRFFIEGLRTDSLMFINFRVAQIVSFISILISIAYIIYSLRKKG